MKQLFASLIICMIFLNTNTVVQAEEWKTEKTEDGKTTVKYNISSRTDENGERFPLIEYTVTTTDRVSLKNCISVLKDASKHKEFHNDEVSKNIKTISENEWVLYYYTKAMWPVPHADCVIKMTFSEDPKAKKEVFTLTAAPTLFEKKDVRRFTYYNETITLKDLEDGNVEVTVASSISPPIKVPLWMMKAAFPDAAYNAVRKIVKLAKES